MSADGCPRLAVLVAAVSLAGVAGAPPAAHADAAFDGVMARASGSESKRRVTVRVSVWHGDGSPAAAVGVVVRSAGHAERACGRTSAKGRVRCSVPKPASGRPRVFVRVAGEPALYVRFWRYRRAS